jgi:hypothetical protein
LIAYEEDLFISHHPSDAVLENGSRLARMLVCWILIGKPSTAGVVFLNTENFAGVRRTALLVS